MLKLFGVLVGYLHRCSWCQVLGNFSRVCVGFSQDCFEALAKWMWILSGAQCRDLVRVLPFKFYVERYFVWGFLMKEESF